MELLRPGAELAVESLNFPVHLNSGRVSSRVGPTRGEEVGRVTLAKAPRAVSAGTQSWKAPEVLSILSSSRGPHDLLETEVFGAPEFPLQATVWLLASVGILSPTVVIFDRTT